MFAVAVILQLFFAFIFLGIAYAFSMSSELSIEIVNRK